jgi:hypothetical protein
MNARAHLRQALDRQRDRLHANIPADCRAAIVALVRAQAATQRSSIDTNTPPDLITGRHITNLGGNRALHLCLTATGERDRPGSISGSDAALDAWASSFLHACTHLAEAETVLSHSETGFMRLAASGTGTFQAWIATKRVPASWRERADFDWWADWLLRQHPPDPHAHPPDPADIGTYRRVATASIDRMAHQTSAPPDASFGGVSMRTYRAVLMALITRALRAHDAGEPARPVSRRALAIELARAMNADPATIGQVLDAFTLDPENAAYHAAVPGIASAPLVRVDADHAVLSLWGQTTEPLLFLMRELRRRDPEAYNNSAHLRETVFRQDLYALFQDKRFVTSGGRLELRRESGTVRTDIDAVIFDRKTGTLAFFELKSQDPFARSSAEMTRQRDNILYANRQVSGVLAWLQRYGAQELLNRVHSRTAKTFRAQRVYPFVLGRYLAHFSDGPEPDRRAAWGTWPQLLRLLDSQPIRPTDANPLASLFARLTKDGVPVTVPADAAPHEIDLGAARIVVYPSHAGVQARLASER